MNLARISVSILMLSLAPLAFGSDAPPADYSLVQPYMAESALRRAENAYLKENQSYSAGELQCVRAPHKTVFFCQSKTHDNDFFCTASSNHKDSLKKVVNLKKGDPIPNIVADTDLTILCEGSGWFCETKAGNARECWSRVQYDLKFPASKFKLIGQTKKIDQKLSKGLRPKRENEIDADRLYARIRYGISPSIYDGLW